MATITVTKDLIGKEDLKLQNTSTTTFSRATSTGGSNTLTKLARSTLNTREFDVIQYGAVGDGTTDDTAAIQAAITAASTAGGMLVFPSGYTFRVQPTTVDTPIFTIGTTYPLTWWMYGATIVVTATTALDPSTASLEKYTTAVVRASGTPNLTFLGGTIDLNRDYATQDPKYSFFKGAYCNYVTFKDITFKDCSNYFGAISMTDQNGGSLARWHSLTVSDCTFYTSTLGVYVEGAMRNVQIVNNKFQYMDIAARQGTTNLYAIDDGYGASTYKPVRGIKVHAFGNGGQTATDTVNGGVLGNVDGIQIKGNTMYGVALGIEVDTGTIVDSQYFQNVSIEGNTIWGVAGITLDQCSNSVIKGNTFKRINSGDVTTYATFAYENSVTSASYLTDCVVGTGIDARKCQDVLIEGNVIDGGYNDSTQLNQFDGILVGHNSSNRASNNIVANNIIKQCRTAIEPSQCDTTLISGNVVKKSKYCLVTNFDPTPAGTARNTTVTWKDNSIVGNTFMADSVAHAVGGNSTSMVELEADWVVRDNTFIGLTTMIADCRMLTLRGFDTNADGVAELGDYTIKNNVFRRFNYTPVEIVGGTSALAPWAVLRVGLTGNEFYSEQSSLPATTVGCVKVGRASNGATLVINGGHNFANNVRRAFILTYPELDGGTETYNFGQWEHDQNSDSTSTWRLFDDAGATNSGATGYAGVFRSGRGIQTRQMQVNCNSTTSQITIANALPYGIIWHVSARNDSLLVMGSSGSGYLVGYGRGTTAVFDAYWGSVDALTNDSVSNTTIDTFPTTPLVVGSSSTQNDIILTAKIASGARSGTFTSGQVVVTVYYSPMMGDDF